MKQQNKGKIRVAAYCRVSTLMEIQDSSFETQRNYYIELINGNPAYELAGIYGDHGVSGRSMVKRPRFCQMLQDCEAGKIEILPAKWIQSHYSEHPPKPLEIRRFVTVA